MMTSRGKAEELRHTYVRGRGSTQFPRHFLRNLSPPEPAGFASSRNRAKEKWSNEGSNTSKYWIPFTRFTASCCIMVRACNDTMLIADWNLKYSRCQSTLLVREKKVLKLLLLVRIVLLEFRVLKLWYWHLHFSSWENSNLQQFRTTLSFISG